MEEVVVRRGERNSEGINKCLLEKVREPHQRSEPRRGMEGNGGVSLGKVLLRYPTAPFY